jgi:uncharacterized protein (TIGR02145 family)
MLDLSHKILAITFFLVAALGGCSKNDEPSGNSVAVPVLTTAAVIVQPAYALSGGTITSDGGAPVTARGVCWSLASNPTIADHLTHDGTGTGNFISNMDQLLQDTVYYVRAYATNSKGTAYGDLRSFRTFKMVHWTVSDIDGNIYPAVNIGTQTWLGSNLKVTRYRNGDPIANVTTDNQWKTLTTGAYCAYDNLVPNFTTYGNLYNWHAASDTRGICPDGWHVPTDSEWELLGNFLGGNSVAGGKMKSAGTIEGGTGLWYAPNEGATNTCDFSGQPGGYRINYGTFYSMGNVAYFWSSSDTASVNALNYVLDANNTSLKRYFNLQTNGFSIRCVKD